MLFTTVLIVLGLLPRLAAAGLADVTLSLPGQPDLLHGAYAPVKWTQRQVEGMRRRALLQQRAEGLAPAVGLGSSPAQLPVCELMLSFRVVDLGPFNFSSIVTLTNHRELDLSHWQIVWRYSDYRHVLLQRVDGAIQLSTGSASGAPVRLVDTFLNDGIPGGGGTYSFLADAGFAGTTAPPPDTQALGVESVNINGMQCSLAGEGGTMRYRQCLPDPLGLAAGGGAAIVLSDGSSGSLDGDVAGDAQSGSSGSCWQHFCCGVVLLEAPPLPAPPPRPPLPPLLPPPPAPAQAGAPSPGQEEAEPPALEEPAGPEVDSSPPADGNTKGSSDPGTSVASRRKTTSVIVPAASAGAAGAAVLAIAVAAALAVRRRRRRSQPAVEKDKGGSQGECPRPEAAAEAERSSSGGSCSRAWQPGLLEGSPTLGSILMPSPMLWRQGSVVAERPPPGAAEPEPGNQQQGMPPHHSMPTAASMASNSMPSPASSGIPAVEQLASMSGSPAPSDSISGASPGGSLAGSGSLDLAQDVVLLEQLGSGAFGTVYRGSWREQPVAVKVLQTACGARSRELDSFKQEARVLAGLRHPHIVAMLAACTVPPNICIIEELAEGGSLHTRLHGTPGARRRRRSPLPYGELLRLAADVAAAMCYLHPRIVHRDLKSQNVLLDAGGRAKVCDFGIAKFKDRTFVSTAGAQAGTPAYMAPEMFDGAPVSEKVDVFSFGVLCWEMLTGEVPWRELQTPMQIIYAVGVMHQRLPIPDACPPCLRQLIEQCWAEEPGQRPGFPAIQQQLQEELGRAAVDAALLEQRCECRATVSESDAAPEAAAASWPALGGAAGGDAARAEPAPATDLPASPFAACTSPFHSSREGSGGSSAS